MNVLYKTSTLEDMMKLSLTEHKVMYAILNSASNNLVDLTRKEKSILKSTGFTSRSLSNAITTLVKKSLLRKTNVRRVYFIEPSFFMVGDSKKIYKLSELIENKDKFLMSQVEEWEALERVGFQENILQGFWETKREEQKELCNQLKKLKELEQRELR